MSAFCILYLSVDGGYAARDVFYFSLLPMLSLIDIARSKATCKYNVYNHSQACSSNCVLRRGEVAADWGAGDGDIRFISVEV